MDPNTAIKTLISNVIIQAAKDYRSAPYNSNMRRECENFLNNMGGWGQTVLRELKKREEGEKDVR